MLVRDAEFLLAVLFKILARDNATTELMNQQNALVAGLALRVLHRLFVERHRRVLALPRVYRFSVPEIVPWAIHTQGKVKGVLGAGWGYVILVALILRRWMRYFGSYVVFGGIF